jgi:hypothetical protein
MRVAFIGGLDRIADALIEAGHGLGVDVEVHTGNVKGRGADALASVVRRADHVIVVTGINSHGGVRLAKQFASDATRVWIVRACGLALAKRVLDEVGRRSESTLRQLARAA